MITEELLLKIRVQQNKCVNMLCKTKHLAEIYQNYKILTLDELIDLELKKLGYKVFQLLPINLLNAIKTNSKGTSLEKKHNYNTRNKKEPNLLQFNKRNYQKGFLVQCLKNFSKLPKQTKEITNIRQFTKRIKKTYFG